MWLEAELRQLRVDAKMIAQVMEEAEVMEESVVGLESQYEYLNHHGRVHTPLLGPATITEKGVEQGQVIGVSYTEGNDCDEAEVMEESMVGLESQNEYLNHHGREHTLLPGPATITEKGVEQGQVIGLFFTEGSDTRTGNIELDWSRVGGVERTIPEVEDVIKYVAEVVEMPRWSTMNYKPSCSKWWDPSDRIYGKYEMYDPYMGKGDGKRRGGQSMDTVGGMIDG